MTAIQSLAVDYMENMVKAYSGFTEYRHRKNLKCESSTHCGRKCIRP